MFPSLPALSEPLEILDPPLDPWWDLYLPARLGEKERVRSLIEGLSEEQGEWKAVAARALELLGYSVEARRMAARAMLQPGEEALALATFLLPEGLSIAELRISRLRRPGMQADAACDAAALELLRGQPEAAGRRIEMALQLCPEHREAARWMRFLKLPDVLRVLRRYRHDEGRVARLPVGRDVVELLPSRKQGWVSAERLRRRVLHGSLPWRAPGSAMRRLQEAGVLECWFALSRQYTLLRARHPLAELELLADELCSRVEEERLQEGLAEELLEEAEAVDEEALRDALGLLLALSTQAESLEGPARRALRRVRGGEEGLWRGWELWLERDVGRARELLQQALPPMLWQLAVDTLRRGGRAEEAEEERRKGLCLPSLSAVAEGLRRRLRVAPAPRLYARGRADAGRAG